MSIKSSIRKALLKNYNFACWYQEYCFNKSPDRMKDPVLVYQMGKVGSSTVVKSLNAQLPQLSVYHIHHMATRSIHNMVRQCKMSRLPIRPHITAAKYFNRLIKRGLPQRLKVVTLTREPVVKNISQFFQGVDVAFPEFRYQEKARTMERSVLIEELTEFFLSHFTHDDPITWFDKELKAMLGIDVFAQEFPYAQGYDVYRGDYADVLLIRLEDLNRCAEEAFKNFFQLDSFKLVDTNITAEKECADIYQQFKSAIKLPDEYLDRMYHSRYATHFYSKEELERFRRKWNSKDVKSQADGQRNTA